MRLMTEGQKIVDWPLRVLYDHWYLARQISEEDLGERILKLLDGDRAFTAKERDDLFFFFDEIFPGMYEEGYEGDWRLAK